MKKLLIAIFIFYGLTMFSQARLSINSGGSVYFHFNSYQKYVNGVTYNDFTKMTIYYKDTTVANTYPTWKLDVKALTPQINGDIAANTLALDVIELEASGAGTPQGIKALSSSDVSLLINAPTTDPGTATVFITYYCGVTNSLLGKEPDYYVVDLLFTLSGE